jgi:hypothetical protein
VNRILDRLGVLGECMPSLVSKGPADASSASEGTNLGVEDVDDERVALDGDGRELVDRHLAVIL